MHQRDRHFYLGGTELDAPQYVYFEKLLFMRPFSIKKDPPSSMETSMNDVVVEPDISPDQLLYFEGKDPATSGSFIDYTGKFLLLIKNYPALYDEHSAMKKYRSKHAWKEVAEKLGGKFTVGKLRFYWMTLMKKYKLYLENSQPHDRALENETIFDLLSFANEGLQVKRQMNNQSEQYNVITDNEMENSREDHFVEDIDEEHLMCEEVDEDEQTLEESEIESVHEVQEQLSDEIAQAVESIEDFRDEPSPKKIKLEACHPQQIVVFHQVEPQSELRQVIPQTVRAPTPVQQTPSLNTVAQPAPAAEDEFDYFGKKVALQLRDLANRNRHVARKGEIKVLQLLMELEESLDS